MIHVGAGELFRRHVGRCPEERTARHARDGVGRDDACDAEVEDLEQASPRDHQVGGLDVAVDDSAAVRIAQPVGELVEQLQLAQHRERLAVPDERGQRGALDVLHRDEELAVVLVHVVHRHDVRMLQSPGRTGFADEAPAKVVIVDLQELEGDVPVDHRVAGQVEQPHAALPQEAEHVVAADAGGNLGHGRYCDS